MRKITLSRFIAFAFLAAALPACGGGTGTPAAIPAAPPVPAAGSDRIAAATTATSGPIVVSGTVTALLTGGFTVDTGYPHGRIHVYETSATLYAGAKPSIGLNVTADGIGSWSTSVQATTVAQSSALIITSGTISGLIRGGFTLNTGSPHGYIHVYTSAGTVVTASAPATGERVTVSGAGSWSTSIAAMTVTSPLAAATPAPVVTSSPVALPDNGASTTALMPQAKTGTGLFQVFDAWGTPRISASQAQSDGQRYGVVWGARPGMASAWRSGNADIIATYYLPLETDASTAIWGAIGHSLSWWQTNHPDWVLYACSASGTPTKIPAYVGDLPDNIPLDIHNPAVISYQIKLAAKYAIANGYNGLAIDEVLFYNLGGITAGTGAYGCGIYQNGSFVRRYAGKRDVAWNADIVAWVKSAHSILASDPAIAPYHLKLVVNHPAGNIADANEQAILANVDADVNETGFSDYGNYPGLTSLFKITLDWMRYAQAHGVAPLMIDKFSQSTALTPAQVEYSIATYLMGNEGGAALFAGNANGYGVEQYHAEYATAFGSRCGGYYGGSAHDPSNPDLWYRRYGNALVIVNSGSTTRASESAALPSGHTYRDLEGRPVSNPLSVAKGDAYVLLTSNGCS